MLKPLSFPECKSLLHYYHIRPPSTIKKTRDMALFLFLTKLCEYDKTKISGLLHSNKHYKNYRKTYKKIGLIF